MNVKGALNVSPVLGLGVALQHWHVNFGMRGNLEAELVDVPDNTDDRPVPSISTARPIGSSPGKNFFAVDSLMMTAAAAPLRSVGAKSRPRTTRIPSARW